MTEKRKTTTPRKRGRAAGKAAPAPSQSLTRGLLLLERLAEAGHGLQLVDLAQRAGLPASTTHRLLATLEQLQYVQQDSALGQWSIGVKAFTVGSAFAHHIDFIERARPFMHRLMEQSGETVNLAVEDQGQAVFVAQVECHEMMRMIVRLGSRAPLHASGVGKALLAAMDEAGVAAVLHRHGLPRFTEHTLTSPAGLRQALETVRKQGYAFDDEEHAVGLRCVAASIHDAQGEILAALSLSGPRARLPDERIAELGALVVRTAAEATSALGGRLPSWRRSAAA